MRSRPAQLPTPPTTSFPPPLLLPPYGSYRWLLMSSHPQRLYRYVCACVSLPTPKVS